jgi:glycosyltransferase involved in cell wall biosynthesis
MIRVAFSVNFSDRLLGQLNYLRNLVEAIYSLNNRKIEPVIFTGYTSDSRFFKDFPATEIIKTRFLNRKTLPWMIHKMSQTIMHRDILMENLMAKHHISAFSHSGSLGRGSQIKTIGWIPDFQHKRLPNLFSKMELYHRDKIYYELCENCSCMVVSSYDALKDLRNFHPDCIYKTHVLQFVAGPLYYVNQQSIECLEKKYRFSGPYFHLPNQFWIHKNHEVVINALSILKDRGEEPLVILTGKTSDHRQPEHFDNLMAKVAEQGLSDYFLVLGVVPYNDLISLMKNSVALINPSLFEGWSSSVEEAKSLGKKIILSDIPIHREQDPSTGIFFKPHDAANLAEIMGQIISNFDPKEEKRIQANAKESLLKRKLSFAETYQDIVLSLFNNSKTD